MTTAEIAIRALEQVWKASAPGPQERPQGPPEGGLPGWRGGAHEGYRVSIVLLDNEAAALFEHALDRLFQRGQIEGLVEILVGAIQR